MKVFVLIEYLTPFRKSSPASEQVIMHGVFATHEAAEQEWVQTNADRDSPRDDYEIIESDLAFGAPPTTSTPIGECGLSTRAVGALRAGGIEHLEQVLMKSEAELLRLPNFGRKYLNELRELLAQKWPYFRVGQFWEPPK